MELFRINNKQTLHGHKLSSSVVHQFFTCLLSYTEFNPRHHKFSTSYAQKYANSYTKVSFEISGHALEMVVRGGFVYEHFSWVFSKEAEENSSKTTALTASFTAQALRDVSVIKENSIIVYIKWIAQSCSFCSKLTSNLYTCCNRKRRLSQVFSWGQENFNPLKPELNSICYLLALLGAHHFLHVSRLRVKLLTFRRLMSYIYGAPIFDVSRSHTTTQHSR